MSSATSVTWRLRNERPTRPPRNLWFAILAGVLDEAKTSRYAGPMFYVPKSHDWAIRVLPKRERLKGRRAPSEWTGIFSDSFRSLVSILELSPHFSNNTRVLRHLWRSKLLSRLTDWASTETRRVTSTLLLPVQSAKEAHLIHEESRECSVRFAARVYKMAG